MAAALGKVIPQGLKPLVILKLFGTTKVVPCYKACPKRVFPQPVKSCPVTRLVFETRCNNLKKFWLPWQKYVHSYAIPLYIYTSAAAELRAALSLCLRMANQLAAYGDEVSKTQRDTGFGWQLSGFQSGRVAPQAAAPRL
jgi:hypothetical protein